MRAPFRASLLAAVALPAALFFSACLPSSETDLIASGDPLAGDPIDPEENDESAVIIPGAPWILPGPDEEFGTADDVFVPGVRGDIDLVVRVRPADFTQGFPPPSPLWRGLTPTVAMPFGRGAALPFAVVPSDGDPSLPAGRPIVPEYFRGLPVLVLAFADLDGDGFIGRTHLDGETEDLALETLELYPVGRRYAVPRGNVAEGRLSVSVGSPAGVRVALGAAALFGPFENPNLPCSGCHSWPSPAADRLLIPLIDGADVAPEGSFVMTHLPFLPDTDVDYRDTDRDLVPAHPDSRVAVLVEIALLPDPANPSVGEAFTLPLDGSSPSIDVAIAYSGIARRTGLALAVDPVGWRPTAGRIVRPTVDAAGQHAVVEIVQRMELTAPTEFLAVPLDDLGNVAHWMTSGPVTLLASGGVTIVEPDTDGDPSRETLLVTSPAGTPVRLAPSAPGAEGTVLVDGGGGISRVSFGPVSETFLYPSDVLFPPDNDGDGIGNPPDGFEFDDDSDDSDDDDDD